MIREKIFTTKALRSLRKIEDFRALSSLRTLRRKYSKPKSRDLLSFIPQVQKIGIDKSCIKSSFLEAGSSWLVREVSK